MNGPIYDREEVQKNDLRRQEELENCGLKFLRFTNDEVKHQLRDVQQKIEAFILENKQPNRKETST